jgi:hypothetical protein
MADFSEWDLSTDIDPSQTYKVCAMKQLSDPNKTFYIIANKKDNELLCDHIHDNKEELWDHLSKEPKILCPKCTKEKEYNKEEEDENIDFSLFGKTKRKIAFLFSNLNIYNIQSPIWEFEKFYYGNEAVSNARIYIEKFYKDNPKVAKTQWLLISTDFFPIDRYNYVLIDKLKSYFNTNIKFKPPAIVLKENYHFIHIYDHDIKVYGTYKTRKEAETAQKKIKDVSWIYENSKNSK